MQSVKSLIIGSAKRVWNGLDKLPLWFEVAFLLLLIAAFWFPNFLIPLLIGNLVGAWFYGKEETDNNDQYNGPLGMA